MALSKLNPKVAASLEQWHDMVAAKNLVGLDAIIHPDAVFRSPMAFKPYKSAQAVALLLRTVLTVHVPGVVCLRGTMLLHGTTPCDGTIERGRCAECWGEVRGVPALLRRWQGQHPDASDALARMVRVGAPARALSTPGLVERHAARLQEAFELSDRVVAVAQWLRDALAANGAPASKLVYCAQGLAEPATAAPIRSRSTSGPLRVGYLGRLDPQKGVHVLVDAVRRIPELPVTLTIHGIPYDDAYRAELVELAGGDLRIQFAAPVGRDQLFETLSALDVLGVPSTWMETGPLVVLEALGCGTPVFGSDRGGIRELLTGVDGCRLLPAGDVTAWQSALTQAAAHPPARIATVVRTSDEVATDMADLYRSMAAVRTTTGPA